VKKVFVLMLAFVCLLLGGCSANADEKAEEKSLDAVSVKIGEINDAFSSSGGRTEELHIYSDKSAEIEGYLDKNSLDSFADVGVTSKGNIEGVRYCFIIEEKPSHQEALIKVQSDYELLQKVVSGIKGTDGLAGDISLPDDFVDDFVTSSSDHLDKHYGGALDDDFMQDISFDDGMLVVSVGHKSRG
jgi:hypothetical protein